MAETRFDGLKNKYEGQIYRTSWIGLVFQEYLLAPGSKTTVIDLAVGGGEDLPHLRNFVGPESRIHAYDILDLSPRMRELSLLADVEYHQGSIRNVKGILGAAGRNLGLIICRAPRIVESITPTMVTYNDWWLAVLPQYAQRMAGSGQMLVTTYTREERDLLQVAMRESDLNPIVGENDFCPQVLRNTYEGPNGVIRAGADLFTLYVS